MFNDVGNKIKKLAGILFALDVIASLVGGIVLFSAASDAYGDEELLVLLGFVVIIAGTLVAWAISLLVYGFGQLITNSDALVEGKRDKSSNSTVKPRPANAYPEKSTLKTTLGNCEICDAKGVTVTNRVICDEHGVHYKMLCQNCSEKYQPLIKDTEKNP